MTFWYIFTFLVSALIISIFLYFRLEHQLIREVDRIILDETKELSEVLSRNPSDLEILKKFETENMTRKYYPFFIQMTDGDGKPVYVSKDFREIGYELNPRVLINAREGKETREVFRPSGGRSFRMISTPLRIQEKLTYILQMGTPLKYVKKNLAVFRDNILAALPIMLILGSLGGWILARKSLAPIGYIASKAQRITSKNLSERLMSRGTEDEMDDLIRTINGMIARLEESFKRMIEFTADASHELKTPICAMRGELEVLLSKKRSVEEYQEGLIPLIDQFDQLNRMIDNLILLSKFDSFQGELKMAPLRLDQLVSDLCNFFQVLAEQKKISLNVDSLPEVTVVGDKMRLQQLFTNLINNAIKYTEKGSVLIHLEKNGDWAQVKVVDTGIGILKEEQRNIFERFYRVDKSRSKETGGSGLGLSIAEWIAHAHHGRIDVQSEVNQGSTFTVYLPIQKA